MIKMDPQQEETMYKNIKYTSIAKVLGTEDQRKKFDFKLVDVTKLAGDSNEALEDREALAKLIIEHITNNIKNYTDEEHVKPEWIIMSDSFWRVVASCSPQLSKTHGVGVEMNRIKTSNGRAAPIKTFMGLRLLVQPLVCDYQLGCLVRC